MSKIEKDMLPKKSVEITSPFIEVVIGDEVRTLEKIWSLVQCVMFSTCSLCESIKISRLSNINTR